MDVAKELVARRYSYRTCQAGQCDQIEVLTCPDKGYTLRELLGKINTCVGLLIYDEERSDEVTRALGGLCVGGAHQIVDVAMPEETMTGFLTILGEDEDGPFAIEPVNSSSITRPDEGQTFSLRTEDDYRCEGGRWEW